MVPGSPHWLMSGGFLVIRYINISRYSGLIVSSNKKVKSVSIRSEKKKIRLKNFKIFENDFYKSFKSI